MKVKVFVIIISYNGMKWLPSCLSSTEGCDVVVVDNASTDGSRDYIKNNFPSIKLLHQQKNLGFGQANNIGIKYALDNGAEAVFLLNQDAYMQDDTIDVLSSFSKKNPEFGILSPIHLTGDGKYLDENFSYYLSYKCNKYFYSDAVLRGLKEYYEVPFVNAAGWYIPKQVFNVVGGFDPIFFHYGEDDNFCQRIYYHNFKIGVIPKSKILHDRGKRNFQSVSDSFLTWERQLKVKWGNINNSSFEEEFPKMYKQERIKYYKYRAKIQLGKAKKVALKLSILKRIEIEITKSKKLNSSGKNLYL